MRFKRVSEDSLPDGALRHALLVEFPNNTFSWESIITPNFDTNEEITAAIKTVLATLWQARLTQSQTHLGAVTIETDAPSGPANQELKRPPTYKQVVKIPKPDKIGPHRPSPIAQAERQKEWADLEASEEQW